MAVFATLWVLSGSFNDDAVAELDGPSQQTDAEQELNVDLFRVRVQRVDAQEVTQRIDLQGEIDADRDIDIRAETEGAIAKLIAKKGDRLKFGQGIVSLAIDDRQARLARANANLKVAKAELKSGLSLNMLSENQHQQNLAEVMSAEADLSEVELDIQHTKVTSPFGGILNELYVEQGDYISVGTALARVVDDKNLIIVAEVPQQHIAKLELGQKVEASLLNGTSVQGEISYISTIADSSTRSFKIEARAANSQNIARFGQSARVSIFVGQKMAHKLSPSLLSLNAKGGLQVKGIDAEGRVNAYTVEILRSENDGVWLIGLPASFDLITVGQGFVSVGQQVSPVHDEAQSELSGAAS